MRKSHLSVIPIIVGLVLNINSFSYAGELNSKTDISPSVNSSQFMNLKEDTLLGYNKLTRSLEKVKVDNLINKLSKEGVFPVDEKYLNVTSNFGYRGKIRPSMDGYNELENMSFHAGTDIAAAGIFRAGAYSVTSGRVAKIERSNVGYGNLVIVDSGDFKTYYAHLDSIADNLKEGDSLKSGDLIGKIGSTGRSTGPHLHLEFNIGDVAVDPEAVLPYIKNYPSKPKNNNSDVKETIEKSSDKIKPNLEVKDIKDIKVKDKEEIVNKNVNKEVPKKNISENKPATIIEQPKQIDINELVKVPNSESKGYGFAFDFHLESVRK